MIDFALLESRNSDGHDHTFFVPLAAELILKMKNNPCSSNTILYFNYAV